MTKTAANGRAGKKKDDDSKPKRVIKRKNKDPNAPKKALSAYFLWLNDNRDRIRTSNPDAKNTDILKMAGKEWNQLEDKSEYVKKAEEQKEIYKKAIAEYKESGKGDVEEE